MTRSAMMVKEDKDNPVELPVDGILDLHCFAPREIKELVRDYLAACRRKGILDVRIIHGKGTGALRRTVQAVLDRMDEVMSYTLAGDASSWGATVVRLKPAPPNQEEEK